MKDQLIEFTTAKLAKEKGLMDSECDRYYEAYDIDGKLGNIYLSDSIYDINAPTQSLLQRWLREKHSIHITINISNRGRYYWLYNEFDIKEVSNIMFWIRQNISNIKYDTYEEALEQGLIEALKLIEI